MKEKNIKLEEEFKKLKNEWLQEAKKILETEYPSRDWQLDGECTVQMAKLQKKFNKKINELLNLSQFDFILCSTHTIEKIPVSYKEYFEGFS